MNRPGTSNSSRYKSTGSLHDLGIDNYPNPEYPESARLSRKEEKGALQNLNNRLAGYIDRVRQLQQENARLTHQVRPLDRSKFMSKETLYFVLKKLVQKNGLVPFSQKFYHTRNLLIS